MNVRESAIDKIRALPEPLAEEVNDFIDFLVARAAANETLQGDFSEYRENLERYEDLLASGKVKW